MIYCKYTEDDFTDLKDMTREQLEAELKDTYIRDLNYWMEQCDKREKRLDDLQQRIDKAIEYIDEKCCYNEKTKECYNDLIYDDVSKLIEILRGEK